MFEYLIIKRRFLWKNLKNTFCVHIRQMMGNQGLATSHLFTDFRNIQFLVPGQQTNDSQPIRMCYRFQGISDMFKLFFRKTLCSHKAV